MKSLKIGTRGSELALAQARQLQSHLVNSEIVVIETSGDRRQGEERKSTWDKKDWVSEIEEALLEKKVDIAIHSAKDVPYDYDKRTKLSSVFKRESPYDICILKNEEVSSIGTSSIRRGLQLKRIFKNASIIPLRGNVPTRIKKLEESSELDAIVIAEAGYKRLKLSGQRIKRLDDMAMLPAVNQGILAVQFMNDRSDILDLISPLVDSDTEQFFNAERILIEELEANCNSAIGVLAERIDDSSCRFSAQILSDSKILEESCILPKNELISRAKDIAKKFLDQGAKEILS